MALDLQITKAISGAQAALTSNDGAKMQAAAAALQAAFQADAGKYGMEALRADASFELADKLHTSLSEAAARTVRRVSLQMM
jgi:hypothetical protein